MDLRSAMVLLTVAALVDIVGCASVPHKEERAYVSTVTGYYTNGQYVHYEINAIDGIEKVGTYRAELAVGRHIIEVRTRWSNYWKDSTKLTVDAIAGKEYLIFAYELRPDQDPTTAEIRPKTSFEHCLEAPVQGVVEGFWPCFVPCLCFYRIEKHLHPPQGRPFDGCCFVWIEDEETKELIDGKRPQ